MDYRQFFVTSQTACCWPRIGFYSIVTLD